MGSVDNSTLKRWRNLEAIAVLNALADYIKPDRTFQPTTSRLSTRWIVHAAGRDWEMLCTGPKFWDTRAERGGAVDLAMHLHRIPFKAAVALLKDKGL